MVKKHRPTSPGRRQLILESGNELTRPNKNNRQTVKPTKGLLLKKTRTNGRNNLGRITCRHRGGGHKRHYRVIDFKRDKMGIPATVASVEYDPNRSAHIALLNYADGEKRYIIAPKGLKAGMKVISGEKAPFEVGCAMPLKSMPLGSVIHNIELNPGKGGQLVRSAGQSAQLVARAGEMATVRLPSGEMRNVFSRNMATFGAVSNSEHSLRVEGKAGRKRWMGIRPTTRGTAMNPIDHPHGGGEGRNSGGIPRTPWAKMTKGKRTRKKKKSSTKFIVKSRRD